MPIGRHDVATVKHSAASFRLGFANQQWCNSRRGNGRLQCKVCVMLSLLCFFFSLSLGWGRFFFLFTPMDSGGCEGGSRWKGRVVLGSVDHGHESGFVVKVMMVPVGLVGLLKN